MLLRHRIFVIAMHVHQKAARLGNAGRASERFIYNRVTVTNEPLDFNFDPFCQNIMEKKLQIRTWRKPELE